ncbi:DUF916 and DUF3324 domain-containing protein [Enterococcus sp. LJL99]
MYKNKWKRFGSLLLIFLVTLHSTLVANAAGDEGNVGYDIQAIIPENQVDKEKTYFDLRMTPGQEQKIEVMINNTSDEKNTYEISINQAYTNAQGFIDYTDEDSILDQSLPYQIKDIVTYEKGVTVDAGVAVKYPITIKMPAESFDGQIMAGIKVMKKNEDEEQSGIQNKVGYILGLNLTETDTPIKRELELVSVEPAVSFGKTSVVAKLRNPTMEAYGHLKYDVDVVNKKNDESIRKVTYDSGMQIAPNSLYDFAIDWDNRRLEAGEYELHLTVTDAKENEWKFDEKFTITAKQAKEINNLTVDRNEPKGFPMWMYIVVGSMLAILIVGIIAWFLYKKKKKQEIEAKKTQKKNRKRKPTAKKSDSKTMKKKSREK